MKRIILIIPLLIAVFCVSAQERRITGKVVDASTNETLPGVNVLEKGTQNGTITGVDGNYSINVQPNATLVFSFIGFTSQEIVVGTTRKVNVTLAENTIGLEEVVAIGYGTTKKKDLTGSVSSIKEEDFNKGVQSSVQGLIQGRAAGVRITQSSAEPGGAFSIQIRGAGSIAAGTQPLYVIDGLPIENTPVITSSGVNFAQTNTPRNPLSSLNPNDIESIEILKDASAAAIYGSRGANGVVIITTKKGIQQGTMKISYNGFVGIATPAFKIDVLNPEEYMRALNEIIAATGGLPEQRVTGITDGGTDWQDKLLRTAKTNSQSLSMSGGQKNTSYYLSLNHLDQEGVLINSEMERYDVRFNLRQTYGDKFITGLNLSTSYINNRTLPGGLGGNEGGGVMFSAINFDPTLPIFQNDGRYILSPFIAIDNPLALANGTTSFENSYRTTGSIFGEYTLLPGWKVKLNLGGDIENTRRDTYVSKATLLGSAYGGTGTVIAGTQPMYLIEGTTNYDKEFKNSKITLLGGLTKQNFMINHLSAWSSDFPIETLTTNSLQAGNNQNYGLSTNKQTYSLLSFISRLNYTLLDKYLLTGSFRADGSSKFGKNNKFGYFPSIAFAWKVVNEEFIKKLNIFSDLKFRSSWGRSGNQDIGMYQSLMTFQTGPMANMDGKPNVTFVPARAGNPDLKWETTDQFNIGADIGFLNNRIYTTIDYYKKKTFDMLINIPTPSSTGFNTILKNVGSLQNTGFEAMISSKNLVGKLKWNTSINLTTLKNKVLNIGNIPEIIIGGNSIVRAGEPLFSFYGYKIVGVWQKNDDFSKTKDPVSPGDQKYADINGDGYVNAQDRVILGNSFPKLMWGLSNNFSYRGIGFDILIEGIHGVSMNNRNLTDTFFPVNFRRNKMAEPILNRWTPENPSNIYPSFITPSVQGNKDVNTYTIEDASYIRISNVKLGYTLPIRKSHYLSFIEGAEIYASGQNLLTFTKYQGSDPATNSSNNSSRQVDLNSYPSSRIFSLGINFNF